MVRPDPSSFEIASSVSLQVFDQTRLRFGAVVATHTDQGS